MVRVEEWLSLSRRQELDLERRCQRDNRDVDLVPIEISETCLEVVRGEVDVERTLTAELEHIAMQAGRRAPTGERRQQRLRPEVLVNVECCHRVAVAHPAPSAPTRISSTTGSRS